MKQPFLSIAIPTFNRAEKLKNQLSAIHESILQSKFSHGIELVVVDNCSTDSTQDSIKYFSNLQKSYTFSAFQNEKNLGGVRNFGQCILRSHGRFVWLLSDDDNLHEDAIEHIYESLSNNKEIGFCFVNYFVAPIIEKAAINIDNKDILTRNISEYIASTMFSESMVSACIYRKSLLSEETLKDMKPEPYQHMHWVLDTLKNHNACIIRSPLFTVNHPGVFESRKIAKKSEHAKDFYLEAHIDFLKYTSYIYDFSLGMSLRIKIHRLIMNENLNQIIYHKITTGKLGYNVASLKLAFPIMLRKFYFDPTFWIFHVPLLLLPSSFARFAEPLRWKYLDLRYFLGKKIKKIINYLG